MYCGQLGIDEAVYNYGNNVLENLKERFEAIDEVAEYNQLKVIAAMQKNRVAEMHLSGTSGYGYNDEGSKPYALFFTLPGYEGLYFQGVGVNIKAEGFGFAAQEYNPEMIIVAPQLNDWGETSARQTIALTEYFLSAYNIDKSKVYAEGYSGGGETMSLVMGMRPDLYTAYLQCSSQWDSAYEPVVQAKTPVYFVVGAHDEYYGSEPSEDAYNNLRELYQQEGLSDEEIDDLLVLDVKDDSYFSDQGVTNQHGQGGGLFVEDDVVMGWLLGK